MMSCRIFTAALAAASMGTLEAATGMLMPRLARAENGSAAHNVVLVHGLFADGSCWSEVIARLQAAGLNVTSVQNPFLRDFAGDLPEARAKVLYAVQQPFHKALLTGKTKHAAWRSKPSFYAVSTEDRTINPELERFMAKRMGAKTIELKASHLSLISHPDDIANLILQAGGRSGL